MSDLPILPFVLVLVAQAKSCTFLVESCTFDRQEYVLLFNFLSMIPEQRLMNENHQVFDEGSRTNLQFCAQKRDTGGAQNWPRRFAQFWRNFGVMFNQIVQ